MTKNHAVQSLDKARALKRKKLLQAGLMMSVLLPLSANSANVEDYIRACDSKIQGYCKPYNNCSVIYQVTRTTVQEVLDGKKKADAFQYGGSAGLNAADQETRLAAQYAKCFYDKLSDPNSVSSAAGNTSSRAGTDSPKRSGQENPDQFKPGRDGSINAAEFTLWQSCLNRHQINNNEERQKISAICDEESKRKMASGNSATGSTQKTPSAEQPKAFSALDPSADYNGKACYYFTRPAKVDGGGGNNFYVDNQLVIYGNTAYKCRSGRWDRLGDLGKAHPSHLNQKHLYAEVLEKSTLNTKVYEKE